MCSSFLSVHVIFDDAFELNDDVDKFVPNSFVKQLMECMEDAARYIVILHVQIGPRREKTCLCGFRQSEFQTNLFSYSD